MGGIGAADIFPRQANMSVSLAHTAIRIFHLFPSRPITALNTGRVSLTNTGLYRGQGTAHCATVAPLSAAPGTSECSRRTQNVLARASQFLLGFQVRRLHTPKVRLFQ